MSTESTTAPRTRWAAIIWGAVFAAIAGWALWLLADDGRRTALSDTVGTVTPATIVTVALLTAGGLLLVAGAAGLVRHAQRRHDATGQAATGQGANGPDATGHGTTRPDATAHATGPDATAHATTGPDATAHTTTGPDATAHATTGPDAGHGTTRPDAAKPGSDVGPVPAE
ncbi:hypothetical protein [Microbacterium sp. p3-SID336]|uniref:hypothetical protein n=1 Tax=Microbacterium sp. p3-SID336 TaxID=2916212 RepID=UPI0021A33911|nr:hypothetical protein [Microbacterium sp. p3-SID336]MCT1479048.1 hypothetical protein [Microbacterium sp. p3-SID336]